MSRRRLIATLAEHPNSGEILGVLARLPQIPDAALPALSAAFRDDLYMDDARHRALQADSPLICEVLASFDAVQALYADELAGRTIVNADVARQSVAAIKDAIAAAYAKPTLSRTAYTELMRAWREVFPVDDNTEPELGPRADDIKLIIRALPALASRCHDMAAATAWRELTELSRLMADSDRMIEARAEVRDAALLTGRARTMKLLRRTAADALHRPCAECHRKQHSPDLNGVLDLCMDAVDSLAVADAVPAHVVHSLTGPLAGLLPQAWPAL